MKNLKQPNYEEFLELKKISTNDIRRKVRLRAEIILSRLQGLTYRMITKKLHCCKDTIKNCLDMWNNSGIGSVITWKRKFKIGMNFKRLNVIEKLLTIKHKSLKLPFTIWSLRTIRAFFIDWLNIKLSLSSIRRDLKVLKFRYGKIEDNLIEKPIDYDEKKAVLTFLKKQGWFISVRKVLYQYFAIQGEFGVLNH